LAAAMSDDDIPDLIEKKVRTRSDDKQSFLGADAFCFQTGAVVKTAPASAASVALACTNPLVEGATRKQQPVKAGRLDPKTSRDSNGYSELHWAVYVGGDHSKPSVTLVC
jgi:hypothetical protein